MTLLLYNTNHGIPFPIFTASITQERNDYEEQVISLLKAVGLYDPTKYDRNNPKNSHTIRSWYDIISIVISLIHGHNSHSPFHPYLIQLVIPHLVCSHSIPILSVVTVHYSTKLIHQSQLSTLSYLTLYIPRAELCRKQLDEERIKVRAS